MLVAVFVGVAEGEGVLVNVGVIVGVGVFDGVLVNVGVNVFVGVGDAVGGGWNSSIRTSTFGSP